MNFTRRLFNRQQEATPDPVTVVSGLPRSGTSMMMKLLEAGGIPVVTDEIRAADGDNPKGYYEFERVKQMDKGDTAWMANAQGKAVKVISALLQHMPAGYDYQILFMHRNLNEVLASQQKMLHNRAEDVNAVDDEEMARLFAGHLAQIDEWLTQQPNMRVLHVDYNAMLLEPQPYIKQIDQFLHQSLDTAAMQTIVDPSLYRNRT